MINLDSVRAAKRRLATQLAGLDGVNGVGLTQNDADEWIIRVNVELTPSVASAIPETFEGIEVKVVEVGPITALAPVDLRVDAEGSVWHVGDPAVRGRGANPKYQDLLRDEVKFIGPDEVEDAPWIQFDARLVALTDGERRVLIQALGVLAAMSGQEYPALGKRLSLGLERPLGE